MSGFLLDTHVLLWWLSDPTRLSDESRHVIESAENELFFSSAGAWEMGIKKSLGRLGFPENLAQVLRSERIDVLDIGLHHALAVANLPMLHQDPFDRMMIAQARMERLTMITRDERIWQYDVSCLAG